MPYITSFERRGYKRGIQHERSLLARLITKKFSSQLEQELSNLEKLNADDLLDLREEILDFESLEEAHQWIGQRSARSREAS